ncbi:protein tweety homolog 1-B-like [Sinocyclocheilus anshuiensis]|uniref:protein tweety homolog 1-B-like n=1 Tax=Sinocyclocheilus anshuiensis TaxID=1608454 RepID=UPI0007BAC981|nr:PREDICTED: protein tweety homolog 1-B-like [Sinocyclocheilus anshuiensis]
MAAIATVPNYTPSIWVRLCHAIPRLDLTLQTRDSVFTPNSWEYQQTLLVLSSFSAIALVLSLLVVLSFLIHYCCCHCGEGSRDAEEEEEDDDASGRKGRGICCVTWVSVAAVTLCCVAIGIGFYGNSEANDGMYQLTSSLLTANYTLASIDLLISDTVVGLQQSVSGPLTSMEEVFGGHKPALVPTRSCRRLSERVMSLLSNLTLGRGLIPIADGFYRANGSESIVAALTPAPPSVAPTLSPSANSIPAAFSPGWAANTLMVNEDYRWLSYVLLLLLDLVVCFFILLGLAKQARWLLILMTVLAWLALFLSWGSLGLETATVVALSDFCFDPNTFVLNSTHFNSRTSTEILDYYLTCSRKMSSPFQQWLYSFLSALAFTAILCSLPGAWRSFHSDSEEYEDSDSESEDPFTSHQARRPTATGSQRGALPPFYSYQGAGWTPPFSSAPPLPTPNVSSNGNPGYENLCLSDRQSPPPSYSPSMLTGYGGSQSHSNPSHSRNLYSH